MANTVARLLTTLSKRLGLGHSLWELDRDLARRELYFRSPPMTPDLLEAIRLVSPQFRLREDEPSRRFWELNQNAACWGELLALEPYLRRLDAPTRVLDLGPGLARSVIFFKRALRWESVPFDLYEGAGESTRYTRAGPRFTDSFCGSPEVMARVLSHNQTEHWNLIDAHQSGGDLSSLAGPYDFVYSFFAIGFHWSIVHFLDELLNLMHPRSVGAFTLHRDFEDLDALDGVPHRVVPFRQSWPRGAQGRLLVLGGSEEALAAGE